MTEHVGYGEGINQSQAEIKAGRGFSSFGESVSQVIGDSRLGLRGLIKGESSANGMEDSFLGVSIDPALLAASNLPVRFSPLAGGGGVLTYKTGVSNLATFWDIVGISPDGFTEQPHGSLRFKFVKADEAGNAVNIYVASKNPAHVGHRDRIIVRKASA